MAIIKCINSESQQFKPVLTDKLVLDAVPTVNSLNGVTSDAVARAVAGASGEVPLVTDQDNGKVLTAVYDEGGAAVEWAAAPSELPDTTGASQGDVLSIGSSGIEWAAPSGGSDIPEVTGFDNGKVLTASYDSGTGTGSYAWAIAPVNWNSVLNATTLNISSGVGKGTISTWTSQNFDGTLRRGTLYFLDLELNANDGGAVMQDSDDFTAVVYTHKLFYGEDVSYTLASIAGGPFKGFGGTRQATLRVPLYVDQNFQVSSDSTTREWTLKIEFTVPDTVSVQCKAYIRKLG